MMHENSGDCSFAVHFKFRITYTSTLFTFFFWLAEIRCMMLHVYLFPKSGETSAPGFAPQPITDMNIYIYKHTTT